MGDIFAVSTELLQPADAKTCIDRLGSTGFRIRTAPQGGSVRMEADLLPASIWWEHHYLTASVYHESHDVLVLLFTFCDQEGRSLTFHFGLLPHVKTKLCIPLACLNGEKLFLDRYPGVLQSVIRGDAFVDRNCLDFISLGTTSSTKDRSLHITGLSFTRSEPIFDYDSTPYVDDLGQMLRRQWKGKTESAEDMAVSLHREMNTPASICFDEPDFGRYGGWKHLKFPSSGFFRTEQQGDGKWWFVDPDGYALFSAGINCVQPAVFTRLEGMEHLLPLLPDKNGPFRDAWSAGGKEYSFQIANLNRVYGADWHKAWQELTERRLQKWGFNTIGNWSASDFIHHSHLPYVLQMSHFPTTEQTIFRDFPDVFSPEYERSAKEFAEQLVPLREDRRLIGYFMRNEPHWAFVDRLNLTQQMLQSPVSFASKKKFINELKVKYSSVESWNTAWDSDYTSFDDLYEPQLQLAFNMAREEDYRCFNRKLIRRYTELPANFCKLADPHHLNLGMRYAWVGSDDLLEGCECFDVFSLNCYQMAPDAAQIEAISGKLGMPVMIGEFHFGAADAGLPAYGIRAAATQQERGEAYRYYVEQSASLPQVIGVHYFQLNDQPVLGRFDGENYQIGLVDGCHRPYVSFVESMAIAHKRIYEVRVGRSAPYSSMPSEIPKTGF
ncbi:hypothetical protein M3231_16355 [Neobacillus mesonae]|nr:hypothetical protein [Neobacillus mesonae]